MLLVFFTGLYVIIILGVLFLHMKQVTIYKKLNHVDNKLHGQIIFSDKQTKEIAEQIADLRVELLEKLDTVKLHSALSPSEVEYLEKQRRFDERIQRIQEELSKTSHIVRKGVEAETLHPGVYNIPHDVIDTKIHRDTYPDVEVAE